jgi:hypothetical protein
MKARWIFIEQIRRNGLYLDRTGISIRAACGPPPVQEGMVGSCPRIKVKAIATTNVIPE